jgi:hypothetical protein
MLSPRKTTIQKSPIYDTPRNQAENGLRAGGKYSETLENQAVLIRRQKRTSLRGALGNRKRKEREDAVSDFDLQPPFVIRASTFVIFPTPYKSYGKNSSQKTIFSSRKTPFAKCRFQKTSKTSEKQL